MRSLQKFVLITAFLNINFWYTTSQSSPATTATNITLSDACRVIFEPNLIIKSNGNNPKEILPGNYVANFETISYICQKGHVLIGAKSNICFYSKWQLAIPVCKKYCSNSALRSVTIKSTCVRDGIRVSCELPILSGTRVTITCQLGYQKSDCNGHDDLYCGDDGEWDYPPYRCQQVCGEENPDFQPFSVGGSKTNNTQVPWHVGIYSNLREPNLQICGGTIVNARIVISAAHCFWNISNAQVNDKSLYKVGAGKYYREYNEKEPLPVQYSDIAEIHIPVGYKDAQLSYINDIAVLVLKTYLQFTYYIKPACIKWEEYNEKAMKSNIIGRVAGWGVTETGLPSTELNTVEFTTLSYVDCVDKAQKEYKNLITGDKFCASSHDGATACQGDAGGGFIIPFKNTNYIKRFALQGIVSNGIASSDQCTGDDFLTAYTNIQYFEQWIISLAEMFIGNCNLNSEVCDDLQDLIDGFKDNQLCDKNNAGIETNTESRYTTIAVTSTSQSPSTTTRPTKLATICQTGCRVTYKSNLIVKYHDETLEEIFPGECVGDYEEIRYSCQKRHLLIGSLTNFCIDRKWNDPIPTCIKNCNSEVLLSPTIQSTCVLNGTSVSCRHPILPGTRATIACQLGYQKILFVSRDNLYCGDDGEWDYPPYRCQQVCGEVLPDINPFIIGGSTTNNTKVPWHVGIYSNLKEPNEQICGGTVVSARIVISAAHCFWNETNSQVNDNSLYKVAAGKYFREYNAKEPLEVQFSDIEEILIPKEYEDIHLSYKSDIALLVLKNFLKFTYYIKPACIRWEQYSEKALVSNVSGHVAGWGTTSSGLPSNELNTVQLLTLSNADCKAKMKKNRKNRITGDKFCVGSEGDQTVCYGDSGGGFLIPVEDTNGVQRFVLQGITSHGINANIECTGDFLTAYTNIQYFEEFVKFYVEKFKLI